MLGRLSRRNAKRQLMDYIIYIITMVITVAFMLSFNMIVFSEEVADVINEKSILPVLIILVSILVVFIMSALVTYITLFILRRRSKEFGLYMLLGIENDEIAKLFIRENQLIYGFIIVMGLPLGTWSYQAVKAVICQIYAIPFTLSDEVSPKAIFLTLFYVGAILYFTSAKAKRVIRKLNVHEFLSLDLTSTNGKNVDIKESNILMGVSALVGVVGFGILIASVCSELLEGATTIAVMLLSVSTYGIFIFLYRYFLCKLKSVEWKYSQNRLFVFRQFTAKMSSMLPLITGVSILITLGLLAINWGSYFADKVDRRVDAVAFDIAFFSDDKNIDFSQYLLYISAHNKLGNIYEYDLYSDSDNKFYHQTQKAIRGKFNFSISSNDNDIFMSINDYKNLRAILGLPSVTLDNNRYYLHCVQENIEPLELYVEQNPFLQIGDTQFQIGGIYSEYFMQQEALGNGTGVLIIVPERALPFLSFQKRVLVVRTNSTLSLEETKELMTINSDIGIISKVGVRNQSASIAVSTVLPLFYLSFVLFVIACTILSVQILSEAKKEKSSYLVLNYLGMRKKQQKRLLKNQLLLFFFIPIVPAIFINLISFPMMTGSISKTVSGTLKIVFISSGIKQAFASIGLFLLFFISYYTATYILYTRTVIRK